MIFEVTSIKISYKTYNTIEKILVDENRSKIEKFSKNGVYQLTCRDCGKKYNGQTDRSFQNRYNEHLQCFKFQN